MVSQRLQDKYDITKHVSLDAVLQLVRYTGYLANMQIFALLLSIHHTLHVLFKHACSPICCVISRL